MLEQKPSALKHLGRIDQKVWKQFQSHLKRTPPLERAEFYAREIKARRMASYRALSLLLGEPPNRVGQYMRLLGLPEPIKAFLRQHRQPEYLRYFTGNRLLELVRLADARGAWRRFQAMVREAERGVGVWGVEGAEPPAPDGRSR